MYIHEAVAKAVEINGYIKGGYCADFPAFVKPTNTTDCCMVFLNPDESCPRWQPRASELMSDKWYVVTEEEFLKLTAQTSPS